MQKRNPEFEKKTASATAKKKKKKTACGEYYTLATCAPTEMGPTDDGENERYKWFNSVDFAHTVRLDQSLSYV